MNEEPPSRGLDSGEQSECRKKAIRMLARREYSVYELSLKLRKKGVEAQVCDAVLAALVSENLLSDRRYAESYLSAKIYKGYGPTRIRLELEQNGVHRATIDDVFAEAQVEWQEQLRQQHLKKYGDSEPANYKEWVKRARYFNNRGFSSELIQSVLEFSSN